MDLFLPTTIKTLLSKYNTKPSKRLGQNFLIDKSVLNKIVNAAQLKSGDTILEIGPGIGTLTQALAQKTKKVIAIEKDSTMVQILKETLANFTNIEIIHTDILKNFKLNSNFKFQISNYKVVANIPYYITSPIIRHFLESKHQPSEIILMVQKEVAQRIVARPPNMSILAVSIQFYATAEIISYVSRGCFWPMPNVDSAIIKIIPITQSSLRGVAQTGVSAEPKTLASRPAGATPWQSNTDLFFKIVKAGFSHPRKQLAGNLSIALKVDKKGITAWLLKNNIQPAQRAETLTIEDWQNLTNSFTL